MATQHAFQIISISLFGLIFGVLCCEETLKHKVNNLVSIQDFIIRQIKGKIEKIEYSELE